MIEDVEGDVDKLPDPYFPKGSTREFDKIDNRKASFLPSSNSFDLVETFGEGFNSEDIEGHLRKSDTNESGSLNHFYFVRWYAYEEVSMESSEEAECLVGSGCNISLMDLQRERSFTEEGTGAGKAIF